ncbi:MAG TPA: endonuclease III [Planctomycetota bacterium]|nr:endonuclease III [Planctomycetota bacterium]
MLSVRSSTPDRAARIVRLLGRTYPEAECALVHSSALQLLVATILSAQCTDVRVNLVTKGLFRKYRTAEDYADADPRVLEQEIRSTGFYRNKTKSIRGAGKLLVERFGGEVPSTMEELLELPGVARKTANVVLGTWFRKAEGVVVDTHVHRLTRRLGLTRRDDPKKIEQDLMKLIPKGEWIDFSHRLIWHGRRVCGARKPQCDQCTLASCCPSAGKLS